MYLYNRFISPPFARNNRMTLAEVRTGIRFRGDCTSRMYFCYFWLRIFDGLHNRNEKQLPRKSAGRLFKRTINFVLFMARRF